MRAGEGVGLEPGDVDDGLVGIDRRPLAGDPFAPVAVQCRGPEMSYSSFQCPALVRPPLAPLVAAALDEAQERRVGDRGEADPEGRQLDPVARALVVVGEAGCGSADLERRRRARRPARVRCARRRAGGTARRSDGSKQSSRASASVWSIVSLCWCSWRTTSSCRSPSPGAEALGGRQRALAYLGEVFPRLVRPEEGQVAAPGPRGLEGVVDLGQVAPDHGLAAEAVDEPEVLEGGDVPEVPDERAHQLRVHSLEVAVGDRGDQRKRSLPCLGQRSGQRLGLGGGDGGDGHRRAGSLPGAHIRYALSCGAAHDFTVR